MGRILPELPSTFFHLPLQGHLSDTSGNGLDAVATSGTALFETVDTCTLGATFGTPNQSVTLTMPSSPILRFSGDFTAQWVMSPRGSNVETIFQCDPLLYAFFIDSGTRFAYADQHTNTFLTPATFVTAYSGQTIACALRRTGLLVELFIGGSVVASLTSGGVSTPAGTEQLRIGNWSGNNSAYHGALLDFRMSTGALSSSQIAADAAYQLSACVTTPCDCGGSTALVEVVRAGQLVSAGPDFGTDIAVIDDVPLDWALCNGLSNLGNALGRRLRTQLGALASTPAYGFDLRDMLNAGIDRSQVTALRGQIVAELLKDERVNAVSAVDFTYNDATSGLALALSVETQAGPFDLIVPVGSSS